jgi:quinol monooxygenase YgiN
MRAAFGSNDETPPASLVVQRDPKARIAQDYGRNARQFNEGNDMIAIIAKLTVQEGKEDEFKAAGAEMVAAVKANETGRTLQYSLTQNLKVSTEFFFIEAYADDAAAADHSKTPHMAAFGSKIGGLLAGRPEITRLDPVATLD